jgi:protein SCO1/2
MTMGSRHKAQGTKHKAQDARHKAQRDARRGGRVFANWASSLVLCALSLVLCALGLADARVSAQPQYPAGYGNQPKPGTPADQKPAQLREVTFQQRLDEQLPLDAAFRDERGQSVRLGDYFGSKPVVLAFVYLQCPMLCSQVMNGISSSLKAVPFTPGKDFDVVLISFDARDTPQVAAEKKQAHLDYWDAQATAGAWHFLTGDDASIKRVTAAAGFNYRWDERSGQFAHVSGLLVVTKDGRLSRYFYGVEYSPKELRFALVESGEGRIGSAIDELLLYCYHYDPAVGQYGLVVMNLVRLGGVVTVAMMLGFILLMYRRYDSRLPN